MHGGRRRGRSNKRAAQRLGHEFVNVPFANYHRLKYMVAGCIRRRGPDVPGADPFEFEDYPRGNGDNYPANFKTEPNTGFHFSLGRP
jgi:hypothetical protein